MAGLHFFLHIFSERQIRNRSRYPLSSIPDQRYEIGSIHPRSVLETSDFDLDIKKLT